MIFVHLPETASLDVCEEWGKGYLSNYTDKPVHGVTAH